MKDSKKEGKRVKSVSSHPTDVFVPKRSRFYKGTQSVSQPTPTEIEEEKAVATGMKEDVPLVRFKKMKVDKAGLEQEKAKGKLVTSVLVLAIGRPRKKLATKKLTGVTQDLKEVEEVKAIEAKRIIKKKEEQEAEIKRRAE